MYPLGTVQFVQDIAVAQNLVGLKRQWISA
jgi:hypothetical protein